MCMWIMYILIFGIFVVFLVVCGEEEEDRFYIENVEIMVFEVECIIIMELVNLGVKYVVV